MHQIRIEPVPDPRPVECPAELCFGRCFTNRMFVQRYSEDRGWHDPVIGPYRPLELDPAAQVLHVGQDVFEGTKAYLRPDGRVNLFRIDRNMARLNRSAQRMGMPPVDAGALIDAIQRLVELEHAWIPRAPGCALYIRPVIIGTEATLEVRAAKRFLNFVILSPVGPYFGSGLRPVPVFISHEHVRAVRGGTGEAKTTANYAGSIFVSEQARARGYQQVLWLDATERRYVEEVGGMNIAFVYEGRHISTPALSGSILPGVTRESMLQLAHDLGYTVSEDRIDVNDMLADVERGRITEAFAIGTGAVVAPVGKFGYRERELLVNGNRIGPVAQRLYDGLTDIQYGRVPDPYGWTRTFSVGEAARTRAAARA